MPLSSAFYSDSQPSAPGMFNQPDHQMSAYQPPPVPDLFRRPMTPAQAQQGFGMGDNFLDRQNQPAPQQPQQEQPQADPNAQGGPQAAAQMAQALLLYQMLQGGPNQFLSHLGIGGQGGGDNTFGRQQGFGQQLGQQGQAFQGLQDPSIQALFNKQSYFKPSLVNGMRAGQSPQQFRQMYGGGMQGSQGGTQALAPDPYESAIQFLRGILGIA